MYHESASSAMWGATDRDIIVFEGYVRNMYGLQFDPVRVSEAPSAT
jgi:hypothetical protein